MKPGGPFCLGMLACALLFAAPGAGAATASATISNFRIELMDLDLGDGIEPSFTLFTPAANQFLLTAVGPHDGPPAATDLQEFPRWTAGVSTSVFELGQATASADSPHFLSAVGESAFARTHARANRLTRLTVTPSTRFTIAFDVSLAATSQFCGALCENSSAQVSLLLFPENDDGPPFYIPTASSFPGQRDDSFEESAQISWDTHVGGWQGEMLAVLIAQTNALVPIPEPESAALILGGLAVLGWVSRRRQPR